MVLRQRDANTLWRDASDGTLEERRYLCQNWRHDVCAVLTDTGKMVETMTYSAYGIPIARPAGDTDSDGDWDATDSAAITGSYDARKDADQNGSVAAADVTHANSITGGYQTLGRGVLSSASVVNRRGYAGYEFEPVLLGAKHHVRNRVLDSETGRWTRRDPLGYVDGMGIYEYVGGTPCVRLDATGLHFVQVERSPWELQ